MSSRSGTSARRRQAPPNWPQAGFVAPHDDPRRGARNMTMATSQAGQVPISVQIKGVDKWFGQFQALANIDLEVRKGEKIVICGPSGSGKSTLIRCINRLEPHDRGRIVVNGIEVDGSSGSTQDVRLEVGMVFQQFNLFPHLTILENCMLAPRLNRGLSRPAAEKLALHYLERVHIANQALKYPSQLSGGQQQRVAIARALCMKPPIMLFDEPTSSLDPEMIKEVLQVMEELAHDGMTMICVTHEMGFARRVANRCVFMDNGEIVEVAPAEEFFAAPRSERLRAFLAQILY
jgi:arginine/ornithine transport system ATP-binding protein